MLPLDLTRTKQILCLGAHADDIEIGCGGTILELTREHPGLVIHWVVFNTDGPRRNEARKGAQAFLGHAAKARVIMKNFRNGFFPFEGGRIKEFFESLKTRVTPDLIFTHYREDRHQDHRTISDLTWNTFRAHLILEYEIPKYDGDIGQPNVFFPLTPETGREKARAICRIFHSQSDKHWFTEDTFLGLMRLRGIECAPASKYAEAFYGRKLTLAHARNPDSMPA